MPTLDETQEESGPVHLLLVAGTKVGKSTYAAEAAIDGFNMIYLDADNGLSALRRAIMGVKDESARKAALQRVHYMRTTHPQLFTKLLLRSTDKRPLLWVPSLNRAWSASIQGVEDDTEVWYINAKAIPPDYIFVVDSWTALTQDALEQFRPEQAAPLLEGTDQRIYGEAKSIADFISNMIQAAPFHVIVQAHPTRYEIYDKPKNTLGRDMKQAAMTLIETIEVPISTSRPGGLELGKRFNHIGWLEVNPTGTVDIDFTRKVSRVSGGPPNARKRTTELTFRELVTLSGGALPKPDPDPQWFKLTTHGELLASQKK